MRRPCRAALEPQRYVAKESYLYHSKIQVEKKLRQSHYIFHQLEEFKDRLFVKGCLDEETGTYPILTHLSSFLTQTRSVFQYAHKEACEKKKLADYEKCFNQKPIFRFFRDLRNHDIHEYTIGSHTTVNLVSKINLKNEEPEADTSKESNSTEENKNKAEITRTISKRIEMTNELIKSLEAEGNHKLAEAAKKGEELYQVQEFNGESDFFLLCEQYLSDIEDFAECGINAGFIS